MRKILFSILLLTLTNYAQAQSSGKIWQNGYCYTKDGKKVEGLFADYTATKNIFGISGKTFWYKKDEQADAVKNKISVLKSLIIIYNKDSPNRDSFVVSENPLFEKAPLLLVKFDKQVKLYLRISSQTNSQPGGINDFPGTYTSIVKEYFYGTNPNDLTAINKNNFVTVMSGLFADKPELVADIKNKKLKYQHLDYIFYHLENDTLPAK